jgi:hypothetical protein
VPFRLDDRPCPAGRRVSTQRPLLTATSSLSPQRKPGFHPNRFGGEFSVAPEFEDGTAPVDFQDSLRFAR